jgi:hypothetical protein
VKTRKGEACTPINIYIFITQKDFHRNEDVINRPNNEGTFLKEEIHHLEQQRVN